MNKKILKAIKEIESCFNKKTGKLDLYPDEKHIKIILEYAKSKQSINNDIESLQSELRLTNLIIDNLVCHINEINHCGVCIFAEDEDCDNVGCSNKFKKHFKEQSIKELGE